MHIYIYIVIISAKNSKRKLKLFVNNIIQIFEKLVSIIIIFNIMDHNKIFF